MPLEARLNTIDSACSIERLSASLLEMSGTGAPGRTATPSPTRPTLTRSAATLPAPANSSSAAGGAITTSNASPPPMRLRISGVVLNAILTSWPDCFRNAAAAALSPGSTAPALNTLISAATAVPATAHKSNAVQCLISVSRNCANYHSLTRTLYSRIGAEKPIAYNSAAPAPKKKHALRPLARHAALERVHRRGLAPAASSAGRRENQAPPARHDRGDAVRLAACAGEEGDFLRQGARRRKGGRRRRQPHRHRGGERRARERHARARRRDRRLPFGLPDASGLRGGRRGARHGRARARERHGAPARGGARLRRLLPADAVARRDRVPRRRAFDAQLRAHFRRGRRRGSARGPGRTRGATLSLVRRPAGLGHLLLDARPGARREGLRFRGHARAQRRRRGDDGRARLYRGR